MATYFPKIRSFAEGDYRRLASKSLLAVHR